MSVLPPGSDPQVATLDMPAGNGMSSETLLLDVSWLEDGTRVDHALAARVAPDPANMPVFPTYDLTSQFRILGTVERLGTVPVPHPYWSEPDKDVIGSPFFVMARVDGVVPPDVMPYNFGGSWVSEAAPEDRARLQHSSVRVLADLHAIEAPEQTFGFLELDRPEPTPLRRHVASQWDYYQWAGDGVIRSPLIERGFAWLEDNWPAEEGPAVLAWGDARIGNMMYRDFEPVAVLDWEMAALAPREIDLAWFIYLHRFFEDIANKYGLPGMPDFLRRDDVVAAYESMSGHQPRDLDFYFTYAALRYAIVSIRTARRQVHFGEIPMPDDVDDLLMNRPALEAMLAGTYWA